jgi:hypothetical protein
MTKQLVQNKFCSVTNFEQTHRKLAGSDFKSRTLALPPDPKRPMKDLGVGSILASK